MSISNTKPLIFLIIYLLCLIVLFAAFLFKLYNFHSVFDYFVLVVIICLLLIDGYKAYLKYFKNVDTFENFNKFSPIEVILLTTEKCQFCRDYLNSGEWEKIQQKYISSDIKFTHIDISKSSKKLTQSIVEIDVSDIAFVPTIYIKTKEGVFFYDDDIHDTDNVINVLNELLKIQS